MINFENADILEKYVSDNIEEINKKLSLFSEKNVKKEYDGRIPKYTDTDIKPYLGKRFNDYIVLNKEDVENTLNMINVGTKEEINKALESYANSNIFYVEDVKEYYEYMIFKNVSITFTKSDEYRNSIINRLLAYTNYSDVENTKDQVNYVKKNVIDSVTRGLELAFTKGFPRKLTNINDGVTAANEGDCGQFLFLARAILAGFNCSNVDVRSSRYDAVIDYKGKILKVQVKGISEVTKGSIQLKDRDRGGAGIDSSNSRNTGKYITADDIDIYVAVDKRFGTCFIIPARKIEEWGNEITDKGKRRTSYPISRIVEYRENWNVISEVAHDIYGI